MSLSYDNSVKKNSHLYNFVPIIDETEIIRLERRLEFCDFSIEEKHITILPRHSWLTVLIIHQDREKNYA